MVVDIRGAVRPDQALHGERFIRIEFLLAVLLFAALAGWDAVWLLHRHGRRWPAMVVGGGLLVFFLGGATNPLQAATFSDSSCHDLSCDRY
jgi:hypothetical protein